MGDLPEGGAAPNLNPVTSHSTSSAELNPFEIGTGNWTTAETAAHEIIRKVQPNSLSEERRIRVVDYIQRLIRTCLGAEVFAYGSVPLKTCLPDGDIDLTTFGVPNVEDTFADDMLAILREEEKNAFSEFVVKDVQLVRAEVKLVKCIVQDIVVDVSFNQIGGLCTLCFLEQVDCLIGRDHLFKRSIILIKAWCYYESRILGAHHGLISTYALETMVLYIFHLFHSKLDGPLAVLFKFLDYFSKFDWETYCISLNGPVRLSSLPDIVVEMPEDSDRELLLHGDFLSFCMSMFSVPYRGGEKSSSGFQLKHLNIFDPLKEINNLGRSVSRGNFYRICSAFSYGARKLARIICQPGDSIANELHLFFSNTVGRHGGGYRSEIDVISFSTRDIHPNSTKSSSRDLPKETEQSSNTNKAARASGSLKKDRNQSKSGFSHGATKPKYSNLQVESNEGSSKWAEMARPLNSSNLSGDLERYMWCLNYGKRCYEQGLGVMRSLPPLSGPPFQNNRPWDSVLSLSHFEPNEFSYGHHPNGFHPCPTFQSLQPVMLPSITYGWTELPKPRGTGTYFPNTILQNQLPQDFRPSTAVKGRNRNQLPQGYRQVDNNGRNMNVVERGNRKASQYSGRPDSKNSFLINPKGGLVDLDLAKHAPGNTVGVKGWADKPIPSSPRTLSRIQKSQSSFSKEQDRILLGSSYLLKDDEDFPPLPA